MKLNSETKEVVSVLIKEKMFSPKHRSLDISKFLDNKQIDLWMLEVAVRFSIRFMSHALGKPTKFLHISGLITYCDIRGVSLSDFVSSDEFTFIRTFIDRIVEDEINS